MTTMCVPPARMTGSASQTTRPTSVIASADDEERPAPHVDLERAPAHEVLPVAEEVRRPLALDAGADGALDPEASARGRTPARHARERREETDTRARWQRAQLEHAVVVRRPARQREATAQRALVRHEERMEV